METYQVIVMNLINEKYYWDPLISKFYKQLQKHKNVCEILFR